MLGVQNWANKKLKDLNPKRGLCIRIGVYIAVPNLDQHFNANKIDEHNYMI